MNRSIDYRGEVSPRSPSVATALALISPGSAWAYLGRPIFGVAVNTAIVLLWVVFAAIWSARGFSPAAPLTVFALGWASLFLLIALDARRLARRFGQHFVPGDLNHPLVYGAIWLFTLALPLCTLHVTFTERILDVRVVRDDSMSPTLVPGDRVLVDLRYASGPPISVGSVVSYRDPAGERRIGRVIGGPGDEVVVMSDILFRNDTPAVRHVVPPDTPVVSAALSSGPPAALDHVASETLAGATYLIEVASAGHSSEPYRWSLGEDEFVILNDNRRELHDSRRFDVVTRSRIDGLPTHVVYSTPHERRALPLALELIASPLLGAPDRTERTGRRAQPYRSSAPPG